MLPSVGSCSRAIVRASVLFPEPDSPIIPTVSPRRMVKSTPSTAFTRSCDPSARESRPESTEKYFVRLATDTNSAGVGSLAGRASVDCELSGRLIVALDLPLCLCVQRPGWRPETVRARSVATDPPMRLCREFQCCGDDSGSRDPPQRGVWGVDRYTRQRRPHNGRETGSPSAAVLGRVQILGSSIGPHQATSRTSEYSG